MSDRTDTTLADVAREVEQEQAQRAHPDTNRLAEVRDQEAAGGRFDLADSQQRLMDYLTTRANHQRIAEAGLPARGREIGDD